MTPSLEDVKMNGSLFNYPQSIYRQDPSAAVEAAWTRVSDGGWILIDANDVSKMGKDPSLASQASASLLSKLGKPTTEPMYFGMIDSFHQIHCLNTIRKHAYWDQYYAGPYGPFDSHNAHELHWTHISHCFDMLLQNLMCSANADVVTGVWMDGQKYPFPDFSVNKKCRNFEQLWEWNEDNKIPDKYLTEYMTMPSNVEPLPAPPELYLAKQVEMPEGYMPDHEVPEHKHWYSSW